MDKVQKIRDLFSDIAQRTVDEYALNITAATELRGSKLTFDELKDKTFQLDKLLREKAVKLIEVYKKETGENPDPLINEFRIVITGSLEQFIKTL